MPNKIQIEENLNQVDVTEDVAAVVGSRTPAVLAWYKIAKDNLSTADLLLRNNKIPHSIFFFQQCVESIVKGTFLECGALNEETIRQICHSPEKAYKTLYQQLDYGFGMYYCEEIPRQLSKATSFEDKLKIGASIANQFTKKYWEDFRNAPFDAVNIEYKNPSAMGLPSNATPLQCHLRFLESMYAENMLLLYACVFSHDVEQYVRYPRFDGDRVTLPSENFCTKVIEEGLPTIVPILKTIIDSIVGDSDV